MTCTQESRKGVERNSRLCQKLIDPNPSRANCLELAGAAP